MIELRMLDLPDDPAQAAKWLERHLVGLDLAELVAELAAVHAETSDNPRATITAILGRDQTRVLNEGLGVLPVEILRRLVRYPRSLLDLQEQVVTQGGPYWEQVQPHPSDMELRLERTRRQLRSQLGIDESKASRADGNATAKMSVRRAGAPWWLVGGLAASFLLAIGGWIATLPSPRSPDLDPTAKSTTSPGWGWMRSDVFADNANLSREAYLSLLADSADEWFRVRPETPSSLAKRLGEFRQGCSMLLLSPHVPLGPADRTWLDGKCREWSAKIEALVTRVKNGEDVLELREETDQVVMKLSRALRDRRSSSG